LGYQVKRAAELLLQRSCRRRDLLDKAAGSHIGGWVISSFNVEVVAIRRLRLLEVPPTRAADRESRRVMAKPASLIEWKGSEIQNLSHP
jgi:hypothetical protein